MQKARKMLFFRILCELCTKCLKKREKNTIFSHFSLDDVQKAQKNAVFLAIFANFVQSVSKNVKNTVFSHFLWDVVQKAQKTLFFLHFLRTLCKVPRKT